MYDKKPGKFAVLERKPGVFTYEEMRDRKMEEVSLFDLDISEDQPLYALPVHVKGKKFGSLGLDRFAEMLTDAENIKSGFIVHSARLNHPRLVFPDYGVIVSLDMDELKEVGVIMRIN